MSNELFGHHDIAAMSDDEFDRYRAELYRQHDRWLAEVEHEKSVAQRKALASPPVTETETEEVGVMYRNDSGDALDGVPAAETEPSDEEWCFTEEQFEALAFALHELRKEFEEGIERAQQRILQATVRLALPGELAEREVHDLRARVIQAEQKIERQLKAAIGDDSVVDLPPGFWKRDIA